MKDSITTWVLRISLKSSLASSTTHAGTQRVCDHHYLPYEYVNTNGEVSPMALSLTIKPLQVNPAMFPSLSRSMRSAAGLVGKPGIVEISPAKA